MTLSEFSGIVAAMGITHNEWISDSEIHTINMASDAAHHYIEGQQDLYFDTTKGILKIKYWNGNTEYTNNVADVFLFCEGITGFTMKKTFDVRGGNF